MLRNTLTTIFVVAFGLGLLSLNLLVEFRPATLGVGLLVVAWQVRRA